MPGVSLRVPEGLRDLMKVYAKEVLRQRPLDIYKFSSQYFESMLQEEKDFDFQGYEVMSPYETIFKTGTRREQNHVPLALVCAIIPEELTELIKEFIKAVLRANPNNICKFAVVYFRSLRDQRHKTCSVQYKSYENYLQSTQCVKLAPYFRCTCGRVIGDGLTRATTNNGHSAEHRVRETVTETNPSSTVNDLVTGDTNSVESSIHYEKYIKAVYIIQRFFRRSLRRLHTNAQSGFSTKNRKDFQMTAETATVQRPLRKSIKTEAEKFAARYPSEENSDIVSSLVPKSDATAKIAGTETTGNRNEPIPKQYDISNAPYLNSDKNQSAASKHLTASNDWRSQQEHTSNTTFSEGESVYETLSLLDSNNAPEVENLSGTIKNPEKEISDTAQYPSNISEDITRNPPVALLESTVIHPASHISIENTDKIDQRSRPNLELEGRKESLHDLLAPAANYIVSDDKKDSKPVTNFKTKTDSLRNALQTTHNGTSLETEEAYTKVSENSKNIRSKRAVVESITYERPSSKECAVIPPESDSSHLKSTQRVDQVLVENASITDQVHTSHSEMDESTTLTNKALLQNVQKLDDTNSPHDLSGPITSNLVFDDKEDIGVFSNIETQAESPLGVKQNIRNRISETEPEYQNLSDDISRKQPVAEDISSEKPPSIDSAVNSLELESSHLKSTQSADQVLVENASITDQGPRPHSEMDESTPLTNKALLQNVQKLDDTKSPHVLSGPVTNNLVFDDKEDVGVFSNIETQAESPLGVKQNIRNRISETEPEYQNLSDDISRKQSVAEDLSSEKPPSMDSAVNSLELESSHLKSTQSADQVLVENASITDQGPRPHSEMDESTPLTNKALLQNVQKLDDTKSPHVLSGPVTNNLVFDDKEDVGVFSNIETQAESPLGVKQNIRNRISETEPEYQNLSDDISRKQPVAEDISSEKPPSFESAVNSPELESSPLQSTQSADQVIVENASIPDQVPTPHSEMDESTPLTNKALLQNVQKLDDTKSPHDLSGPVTSNLVFDDKEEVGVFSNIKTQAESPLAVKQNIRNRISETKPEYQNLSDDISRKQPVTEDISLEKPPSFESAVNSPELESSHLQSTQSADQVLVENASITDQGSTPHSEMDESTPLTNKALLQNVQKLDDTKSPHDLSGPVTSNLVFDDKEDVSVFSNIETQAESPLGVKQNIRNRISETEPEYQNLSDDISRKQPVAEDISSEKPPSIDSAVNSLELESSHLKSTQSADQVLVENASITDQGPRPHSEMDESTPLTNKALLQNVQKLDDTNPPHDLSGPVTSNLVFDDKGNVGVVSNFETQAESPLGVKQNIRNTISETEPEYQNLSDDISRKQPVAEDISSEKPPSIDSAVNSPELESSHLKSTQSADQVLVENASITYQGPTPHSEMDESTPLTNKAPLQNVQKLDDTKSPHELSGPVTNNLVFDDKEDIGVFSNIETQAESPLGVKQNIRNRISETEPEYQNLSDDISRKRPVAEDISSENPPSFESAMNSPELESSPLQSTQSADQFFVENASILDQVPTPHAEMDESTPLTNKALLPNVQKLDDTKSPHDLSGPVTSNLVFDDKEEVGVFSNIETQSESPLGVKQNIRNRISETEPEYENLSDDISSKKPPSIESAVNSPELGSIHLNYTQSADQVLVENASITDQGPTPYSEMHLVENASITDQLATPHSEMDESTPLTNTSLLQNVQKLDDTKPSHELSGPVTSNLVFDDKGNVGVVSNFETQAESPLGVKQNIRNTISETEPEYENLSDDISRKQTVAEDISSEKPPSFESAVNSPELESSHLKSTQSADQVLVENASITYQGPTPHSEMDESTPLTNKSLLQNVQKLNDTKSSHELSGPVTSNLVFDDKENVGVVSNIATQAESSLGVKQNIRNTISETEPEYENLSDDISRKQTVAEDKTTRMLSSIKLASTNPRSTESKAEDAKRRDQRDISHLELDMSKPSINTVQLQKGFDLDGKTNFPNLSVPAKSQFVPEDKKESSVVSNTEAETENSPDANQNTQNGTSTTETEYELPCEGTSTKPAVTEDITSEESSTAETPLSPGSDQTASLSALTQNTIKVSVVDPNIIDQSPALNSQLSAPLASINTNQLQGTSSAEILSGSVITDFLFDDMKESAAVSYTETHLESPLGTKQNIEHETSETETEYQKHGDKGSREPRVSDDMTFERPSLLKAKGKNESDTSMYSHTDSNIMGQTPTPLLELDVSAPSVNKAKLQHGTELDETKSLQDLDELTVAHFASNDKEESKAISNSETESLLITEQYIQNKTPETKTEYLKHSEEESTATEDLLNGKPSLVESKISSPETDYKTGTHLGRFESASQKSVQDERRLDKNPSSRSKHSETAPSVSEDIHLTMNPAAMLENPKNLCGLQNETNRNESMEPFSVANRTGRIEEVPSTDKATNNFEQITKGVLISDVHQPQNQTIVDGLTNTQKLINTKNKVDSKNNLADHTTHESPTPTKETCNDSKALSNTDAKPNDKASTTNSPPVAESCITKSTHSSSSIRPDGLAEKDVIDKVSAATDCSTTVPSSASGNALTNRSTRIGTQNSHESHSGTSNSNKVDHTLSKPIKQPKQPSREYCIGIPLEAPIAELQLKSFKTSDTAPPWYASITEDSSTGHNETELRRVTKPKAAISSELITKSDGLLNYDGNEVSSSNSLGATAFERDLRELNNNRTDGSTEESKDTILTSTEDPQNERMPTYLYGIHTPRQTPIQSRKVYKKPTAFTVPFRPTDIPDVELEKCEEKGYTEAECSNNEPEQGHANSVKDTSNNNLNIAYLELNQVQTQLDVQSPKPLSDQIGESDLRQTENKEIGHLSSSNETNIQEDPGDVGHRTDINLKDQINEPMLDTIVELGDVQSPKPLSDQIGESDLRQTENKEIGNLSSSNETIIREEPGDVEHRTDINFKDQINEPMLDTIVELGDVQSPKPLSDQIGESDLRQTENKEIGNLSSSNETIIREEPGDVEHRTDINFKDQINEPMLDTIVELGDVQSPKPLSDQIGESDLRQTENKEIGHLSSSNDTIIREEPGDVGHRTDINFKDQINEPMLDTIVELGDVQSPKPLSDQIGESDLRQTENKEIGNLSSSNETIIREEPGDVGHRTDINFKDQINEPMLDTIVELGDVQSPKPLSDQIGESDLRQTENKEIGNLSSSNETIIREYPGDVEHRTDINFKDQINEPMLDTIVELGDVQSPKPLSDQIGESDLRQTENKEIGNLSSSNETIIREEPGDVEHRTDINFKDQINEPMLDTIVELGDVQSPKPLSDQIGESDLRQTENKEIGNLSSSNETIIREEPGDVEHRTDINFKDQINEPMLDTIVELGDVQSPKPLSDQIGESDLRQTENKEIGNLSSSNETIIREEPGDVEHRTDINFKDQINEPMLDTIVELGDVQSPKPLSDQIGESDLRQTENKEIGHLSSSNDTIIREEPGDVGHRTDINFKDQINEPMLDTIVELGDVQSPKPLSDQIGESDLRQTENKEIGNLSSSNETIIREDPGDVGHRTDINFKDEINVPMLDTIVELGDVQSPKPLSDQIGESDLRQTENKEIGNLSSSNETIIREDPGDVGHRTDINFKDEINVPILDTIVELNEGSSKIELYDYAELDSKSDSRWSKLKAMDENISKEYMNQNPNSEDNHASPGSLNEAEITADRTNDVDIDSIPVEKQNCKEKSAVQIHKSDRKNTKETYLSTTPDAQIEEAAASTIQRAFRKYIASRTNTDELKTSTNSSWNSSQTTQIFIENDAEDSPAFSYSEVENDELNENKPPPFDDTSTFQISEIKAEQDQENKQKIEDKKVDWFVGNELIQTSKVVSLNRENKSPTNDLPITEFPDGVESKPSGPFPVNHLEINTSEKNLDSEMSLQQQSATQRAIDGMQLQPLDEYRKAFAPQANQPYNEELGAVRKKSQSAGNEGDTPVASNEFLPDSDRTNMAEIMAAFLVCERTHTSNTNKSSNTLRQTPVNNEISFIKDFVSSPINFAETDVPYEQLEEHCVKRSISLTYLVQDEDMAVDLKGGTSQDYASDKTGNKLQESDEPSKYAHGFENNAVTSPDLEDDKVIVNRLQREDTRENSAQSDCVIFGESYENKTPEQPEKANAVIYEDAVKFIESPEFASNTSLCLDDDTSQTIRKQMMAYSLSEADSDAAGASMSEMEANNVMASRLDSSVSSALADVTGTSTETESTIVSAANISRADTNSNETIDASLESLVKVEAVRKIQKAYRTYQQKTQRSKIRAHLRSSEQTMNSESSLAAKRMTLQRGNALRNDSAPDEDHLASTKGRGRNKPLANDEEHDAPLTKENNPRKVIGARNAGKLAAEVTSDRTKKILDNKLKWLSMRQNSMPVQIDSEVFRVIPKHMRKRIKSAEGEKKPRRRILKD